MLNISISVFVPQKDNCQDRKVVVVVEKVVDRKVVVGCTTHMTFKNKKNSRFTAHTIRGKILCKYTQCII